MVRYAATVLYVPDVAAAVAFYERAFGLERVHLDEHENGAYAELATGATVIAFASHDLVERHVPMPFSNASRETSPPPVDLLFVTGDVHAAYERAVEAGGEPITAPERKPWGQTVGLLRDLNGFLVELSSPDS